MPRPNLTLNQPRVLHFNDCAGVGAALVDAAAKRGYKWDYLGSEQTRPSVTQNLSGIRKLAWIPYIWRDFWGVVTHDVIHVHYATAARALRSPGIPKRPYLLHLHGTDIREQWKDPRFHSFIQATIDGAYRVYYTNVDTVEEATTARPDAKYMPAFVDFGALPKWAPQENKVLFASRWDASKGVAQQLELLERLVQAYPEASFEGIDWGPQAVAAEKLGVKLRAKMGHADYLAWLATGSLAVGQVRQALGVSEFEAMAIGLPVAALGEHLPRPDDGSRPPVLDGTIADVMEHVGAALADPRAVSARLQAPQWVRRHHDPSAYVEELANAYAAAAKEGHR